MLCIPLLVNHSGIYWLLLQSTTVFHPFSLTKCVIAALTEVWKIVLKAFVLMKNLTCSALADIIKSVEFSKIFT